jgi:hypothetical protein
MWYGECQLVVTEVGSTATLWTQADTITRACEIPQSSMFGVCRRKEEEEDVGRQYVGVG